MRGISEFSSLIHLSISIMFSMQALIVGINVLSFLLFFSFLLSGTIKLTSLYVLQEAHAEMVRNAKQWLTALYLDRTGMDDVSLRVAIGVAEVVLSFWLLTPYGTRAAYCLAFIMTGAVFVHVRLDTPVTAPLFMLSLLIALIVLRKLLKLQIERQAVMKSD